jgi:hypothetical protein
MRDKTAATTRYKIAYGFVINESVGDFVCIEQLLLNILVKFLQQTTTYRYFLVFNWKIIFYILLSLQNNLLQISHKLTSNSNNLIHSNAA